MNSQYIHRGLTENLRTNNEDNEKQGVTTSASPRLARSARQTHIYNFQSTDNNIVTIEITLTKRTPILNEQRF